MRVVGLLLLSAVLSLGACSPREDAKAPPLDSAAADRLTRAATAEAFVRETYAAYGDAAAAPRVARGEDPRFSARLRALFAEDARLADGEVGLIEADPICACQDHENLTLDTVAVTLAGPTAAGADVAFTNLGEPVRQTLRLVLEAGRWRIDDIVSTERPSLVAALVEANAEAARAPRTPAAP
ncbi:MAG TPA: DUF3828 domain-containing protein [Caulobacteraceae bacterium]